MGKAAFYSLWCFILVLPWDVLTSFPMLGSIPRLVGLMASAIGILHVFARQCARPPSWFHVFAVLFVAWAGLTSFWSLDPEMTRTRFLTYLQLVVLVWLIWEIAWSPGRRRALLEAYVLGATVAAVATIYNYLRGIPLAGETGRFTALNADPNELGLTLMLGLPIAWYLGISQRRWGWLWQLYLPVAVTATLLTGSRGAALTGLVALGIVPLTLGRLRRGNVAAAALLAIGTVAAASSFVPATTLRRVQNTRTDIASGYFGGRGAIWKAGLDVVAEHPFTGIGAGAFGTAVEPTLHKQKSSHQVLLAVLVETGVVGLCLFLAMVIAPMVRLSALPSLERRLWLILLAALAIGSLSLAWDYRKQFWFILGLLAAEAVAVPRANTRRRGPSALSASPDDSEVVGTQSGNQVEQRTERPGQRRDHSGHRRSQGDAMQFDRAPGEESTDLCRSDRADIRIGGIPHTEIVPADDSVRRNNPHHLVRDPAADVSVENGREDRALEHQVKAGAPKR
jgi:O-antigen ligase